MHQPLGVFQDLQLSEIAPNLQFPELANNCARPAAALRDLRPQLGDCGCERRNLLVEIHDVLLTLLLGLLQSWANLVFTQGS